MIPSHDTFLLSFHVPLNDLREKFEIQDFESYSSLSSIFLARFYTRNLKI